jgi:glycosyltransferase involved in cell wall biosynthesis
MQTFDDRSLAPPPPVAGGPETAGRALRVAYFVAYPQRMAGANRSLYELVTQLPARVRPLVVVVSEGEVAAAYRAAGVETVVLSPAAELNVFGGALLRLPRWRRAWIGARGLPGFALRLSRLLRERGVDLLHVNDPRGSALAAPAARLAGVRVVGHLRGEFALGRGARWLYERSADRLITVSDGARDTLSPYGRERAVTVYNGIRPLPEPSRALPWLAGLRSEGVAVVACMASVVPFKGHHHLIRAVARLNAKGWGDRFVVVCVGDTVAGYEAYHRHLAGLLEAEGVRNLTFAGWQPDPFPFYAHADISVLPSVSRDRIVLEGTEMEIRGSEGFPRTHLEAMQLALPVVGTRIAGVPEQVEHGVTGLVVEPADPGALAEALETLLASPELRVRMGCAGAERVARLFSTRAYVDGVMRVYGEVLDG